MAGKTNLSPNYDVPPLGLILTPVRCLKSLRTSDCVPPR
jgi:hypothetical protein